MASAITLSLVLFLLLFSTSVQCQATVTGFMEAYEIGALQSLWFAWNKSTFNPASNLVGWRTLGDSHHLYVYGFRNDDDPCYGHQWRGLVCERTLLDESQAKTRILGLYPYNSSISYYTYAVIGLVLNDASIAGEFPGDIIQMNTLTNLALLTLTGNPGLTGPVPNLGGTPIKILDLHGNSFNGTVPWDGLYYNIEYLDLSDNQLSGEFTPTGQTAQYIHTLKLSHNNFSGHIDHYYASWFNPLTLDSSPLVTVDLSNNKFAGPFCNLSKTIYLNTLNVSNNLLSGRIYPSNFNGSGMPSFRVLDVSHNNFSGPIPNLSPLWTLQTLDLSWNGFSSGLFPNWLMRLNALQTLALNGNNLIGEFHPHVVNNLTRLRTLLLDNNTITGTLNIEHFKSANMSLQLVSMRNNNITDVTYNLSSIKDLGDWVTFNLEGNPYCSNLSIATDLKHCVCEGYCVDSEQVLILHTKSSITRVIIIASTVSLAIVLMVVVVASILFWKNKREKYELLQSVHQKFAEYELKPTLFAFSDLHKATQNFHQDMKLGQGAFGAVYKGHLPDGSIVAVKQLLTPTQQNMEDFLNEIVLLTSVKHRNLVKLKGCCVRGKQRLLVYEYMEKYDLADMLFGEFIDLCITCCM